MSDTQSHSMDVPTFVLTGVFAIGAILSLILLSTGVGAISAAVTIFVLRFFGRPHLAAYLVPTALAVILLPLTLSPAHIIWAAVFESYYQSIASDASLAEIAQIWLDPSRNALDEAILVAFGIIVGGIVELRAEDRHNSKLAQLSSDRKPGRRRAPVAFICAWLASYRPASHGDKTFLGTNYYDGRSFYISDSDLNKHALVLGTTGKGKTTSLMNLAQAAMEKGQFTVWLDGKGDIEIMERVRRLALSSGRPFYVFNTLNIAASCAYNPLATGDYTSKADRVMNLREWTEPHHESLAAAFLQSAFKILDSEKIVIDVVQAAKSLSITYLLGLLRTRGRKKNQTRQKLADEIAAQAVAEKTSIDSLRSDLRYIANSSLGVLFDTAQARRDGRPILNLEEARKEGAVVYVLLSPLLFQKAAPKISRVFINDLKAITVSARSTFKLFVDESTFATEAALNLINMGRSFSVCAIFSSQTISDFHAGARDLGEAFVKQVIASVNFYIVHQLNESDEAETISRLIGTVVDTELTAQSQNEKLTGAASVRSVRQFKVHPEFLKFIGTGEAYVLNKNNGWSGKIKVRNSKI